MKPLPRLLLLLAILAAAGCAPAGPTNPTASPSASASTEASPSPAARGVHSVAEAAARVLASDPLFAGLTPPNPDMIGQCCWYEARETESGYEVAIRVGWGDCPSGCISAHGWQYVVGRDGSVSLASESGDVVPDGVLPGPGGSHSDGELAVVLRAGPTCPVEQNPPDPACAPRPVANADLVVRDAADLEVATGTTDADGVFRTVLPPGVYVVTPRPVEGLMGAPEATAVSIAAGGRSQLTLEYDTGIR